MKNLIRAFLFAIVCLLFTTHCGLISDQPDDSVASTTTTAPSSSASLSKEVGLQCFGEGDLGCAQKNYCAMQGEPGVGLRCCLAGFLQTYFSENTQTLGKMLGYAPVGFTDMKGMSRQDLVDKKGLPFAELFLLSKDEVPEIKELLKSWGMALSTQGVSTAELNQRLAELGVGLESSATCLEDVMGQIKADEVEKEIFNSESGIKVSRRDLHFLRFALKAEAYFLQFVSHYDWGFEKFPAVPLSDDFLKDINGQLGEGDARWGELPEGKAGELAGKFALLSSAFSALQSFSELKDQPSTIDDYLNWRLSQDRQEHYSGILKAANESLKNKKYVALPEDDYLVNLSSLSQASLLPNSLKIKDSLPVLERDEAGDIQRNKGFTEAWAWNIVRPLPIEAPKPKN